MGDITIKEIEAANRGYSEVWVTDAEGNTYMEWRPPFKGRVSSFLFGLPVINPDETLISQKDINKRTLTHSLHGGSSHGK